MKDILLDNINNYYEKYNFVEKDIFISYLRILNEYIKQLENINFIKYNNIYLFISQGLKTISNVFKIILIYSKNLDLSFNYSKKAIFYYLEYMKQIDIESNFIKLTSTDASIFVFKKTIFLIDNEFRKNYVSKYYHIENNVFLFTEIIKFNFDHLLNDFLIYNDLKNIYNNIFLISSHIVNISNNVSSNYINNNLLLIYQFNNIIVSINLNHYKDLLLLFLSKKVYNYCNSNNNLNNIILNNLDLIHDEDNINNDIVKNDNDNHFNNDFFIKYINWLIIELNNCKL